MLGKSYKLDLYIKYTISCLLVLVDILFNSVVEKKNLGGTFSLFLEELY